MSKNTDRNRTRTQGNTRNRMNMPNANANANASVNPLKWKCKGWNESGMGIYWDDTMESSVVGHRPVVTWSWYLCIEYSINGGLSDDICKTWRDDKCQISIHFSIRQDRMEWRRLEVRQRGQRWMCVETYNVGGRGWVMYVDVDMGVSLDCRYTYYTIDTMDFESVKAHLLQ